MSHFSVALTYHNVFTSTTVSHAYARTHTHTYIRTDTQTRTRAHTFTHTHTLVHGHQHTTICWSHMSTCYVGQPFIVSIPPEATGPNTINNKQLYTTIRNQVQFIISIVFLFVDMHFAYVSHRCVMLS